MANEILILEKAICYLEKLSAGIDPLTDHPVNQTDIVRDYHISQCLSYVASVLGNILREKSEEEKIRIASSAPDFHVTLFDYSQKPISISEIIRRINNLHETAGLKTVRIPQLIEYLVKEGILKEVLLVNGKTGYRPTMKGEQIGITIREFQKEDRSDVYSLYNLDAQNILMQMLDTNPDFRKPRKLKNDVEIIRRRWEPEEDAELITMFHSGEQVAYIARYLCRSENSICKRLIKLGEIKNSWEAYE